MRKYGESKTTRIMMATVPHVTSGLGLRKFQTDGFLLTRVYLSLNRSTTPDLKFWKPQHCTVLDRITGNFKANHFCRLLDKLTRRAKPIRIIGDPDNQRPVNWNCAVLSQMQENSINDYDRSQFVISVVGGQGDYWPWAPKGIATPLVSKRRLHVLDVPSWTCCASPHQVCAWIVLSNRL